MAKKIYFGVDSKARAVKKMFVGINGVARKVKKGYIGVNGVARQFYSGNTTYFGSILQRLASGGTLNRREINTGSVIGTIATPLSKISGGPMLCRDRFYVGIGQSPTNSRMLQTATLNIDTFAVINTFESLKVNNDLAYRGLVGGGDSHIIGGMSARAFYIEKTDTLTGAHLGSMGQYYYEGTTSQAVTSTTFTFAAYTYSSNDDDYLNVGTEWDFSTGSKVRNFNIYVTFSASPRNTFGTLNGIVYTYFSYWNSGWYTWDYATLAKLSELLFTKDSAYALEGHIVPA